MAGEIKIDNKSDRNAYYTVTAQYGNIDCTDNNLDVRTVLVPAGAFHYYAVGGQNLKQQSVSVTFA
jgi:hypothetical protein